MIAKGLAGIEVDDSAISDIDGFAGVLRYRGYAIEDVVTLPFSDAAYLVLEGELPNQRQAREFQDLLFRLGQVPAGTADIIRRIGELGLHPMSALQAAIPLLAPGSATATTQNPPAATDRRLEGLTIAARIPHALALLGCGNDRHLTATQRNSIEYPDEADYSRRALLLLTGANPTRHAVQAFQQVQILQLEHSFNASTFTARVVGSTLAPMADCLAAAVGALHGPLHGGADEAALRMARTIGSVEQAESWLTAARERGEKIPGMGHREYRVVDPRAVVIEDVVERLFASGETVGQQEYAVLKEVERAAKRTLESASKPLRPNIEFYKGVVLLAVGIQPEWFTTMFAAARCFGYVAHVLEGQTNNRIIRPQAHYVGSPPRTMG